MFWMEIKTERITDEQYSEWSESGNGRVGMGGGLRKGCSVSIADPVTFKSSHIGWISSSFMVNASE